MSHSLDGSFRPAGWLRSPHVQSMLASSGLRRAIRLRSDPAFVDSGTRRLVETGEGVRLQAFVHPPRDGRPRGRVVVLHGWEGSHRSGYVVSASLAARAAGWEVVRLDLRDHGETHHLNGEPFHSARLREVLDASVVLAEEARDRPFALVGFSLGGNFVVRVAARWPRGGAPLAQAVAVSPVLDPRDAVRAMKRGLRIYREYFLYKWARSIRRKEAAFPGTMPAEEALALRDLDERTAFLIEASGEFPSLDAYYDAYTLNSDWFGSIDVPLEAWTATDDPVIPVDGWERLRLPASVRLVRMRYGGHCGFVDRPGAPSAVDRRLVALLSEVADPGAGGEGRTDQPPPSRSIEGVPSAG